MLQVLVCLIVLVGGCTSRTAEPLGPLVPREAWFDDGTLRCESPDVCGFVRATCRDLDGPGALQGCVDGRCLDGPAFGDDYCDRHGGKSASNSTPSPYVCPEGPDRDACVTCRATAGVACVNDSCRPAADALIACLTPGFEDLPDGIERGGWRIVNGDTGRRHVCHSEASLFESCVESACVELRDCPGMSNRAPALFYTTP